MNWPYSLIKILTTFDLQIACLSVMRVIFEVHWTREHKGKPESENKCVNIMLKFIHTTYTQIIMTKSGYGF